MAHIKIIDFESAEGRLYDVYKQVIDKRGKLAEVHKIHSLNPESLLGHINFYMTVMFGKSPLTRARREMIGVLVSSCNKCHYCVMHHSASLNHYWKDKEKIRKLTDDYQNADLSESDVAICNYAVKLTQKPASSEIPQLIEELRNKGLSDQTIHDVALVTSYFNFVNRIVLGLGAELEEDEGRGYKY